MPFRFLLFAFLIAGAGACSHRQYAPNAIEMPFLTEKGQSSAALMLGHPDFTGFIDLHAAYNPWRNVTGMLHYQSATGEILSPFANFSKDDFINLDYVEGAFGAKKMMKQSKLGLGLYAGGGYGRVKNGYGGNITSNLDYNKYFLQPTLLFHGEIAHFGLGIRISNLAFNKGQVDVAIPGDELREIGYIGDRSPFTIVEAGLQMGFHFKPFTWILSVQRSKIFDDYEPYQFGFDPNSVLLGCKLNLHEIKRKKRTSPPPAAN